MEALTDAPWWARFIAQVGISTAAAAALLWFLLANIATNQTRLADNDAQIVKNQTQIIQLLSDHAHVMEQSLWVQLAQCVNTAKNDAERTRCLALQK